MRRLTFAVLGACLVLAIILVGPILTTAYAAGPELPPPQAGDESPCIPEHNKYTHPQVLLLGERTTVTLQATVLCAGETFPLHIVLVLDASGSMAGQPLKQMQDAAIKLVNRMELRDHPETEIGVVQFNSTARTLTGLSNNQGRVVGAIRRVRAGGGTAIDLGIQEGLKVLIRGRSRTGGGRSDVHEVMVVLSDGGNNAGCPPVLRAANQAKGQGVLMITVCVGPSCDAQCMRQAASSPRYFYQVENAGQLIEVLHQIRNEILNITLKKLTVTDVLPDNMLYVDGSADPEPKSISPNRDILEWQTNYVPSDGVTFTFQVEPQQPGDWPTNIEASGIYRDNQNREGTFVFNVPWVTVLKADPIPTRTEPPPTPTVTPTFTPGPTPTPTRTPTPTPTPRPKPVYLPIMVRHPCTPSHYYSDVALVLDISTSMNRLTRTGRTKLEATLEQAQRFVGQMRFEPDVDGRHDQVAVVGFNFWSWIEQPLSNNPESIRGALARLPQRQAEFTRLDLAIVRGIQALSSEDAQELNTKVIILLTDGLPNQVPYDSEDGTMETTVLRRAANAKNGGIRVYTIAIGEPEDTNPGLLSQVATHPSLYYYEPDPEDLARVYSEIVGTFGCPKSRLEWDGPWPDVP